MTRLQREVHRRVWLAMLVLLPVLCAWALGLRHSHSVALNATAESGTGAP